jgi:hypothetical protein
METGTAVDNTLTSRVSKHLVPEPQMQSSRTNDRS